MQHLVAKARPGTLLFRSWLEAEALWLRLVASSVGLVALFLMPDHLHLLLRGDGREGLASAMSAYARWRNAQRGEQGPVFLPAPPPTVPLGAVKEWRDERYIHLQACRAGLAQDPLAWPFSTHRDAVGLSLAPVRRPHPEPAWYHHRVSADGTVHPAGTELPVAGGEVLRGTAGVERVGAVVSSLTRTPMGRMRQRGAARGLWIRASRALVDARVAEVADVIEVDRVTVQRRSRGAPGAAIGVVERAVADPRFQGLHEGDLRRLAAWRRYRHHR